MADDVETKLAVGLHGEDRVDPADVEAALEQALPGVERVVAIDYLEEADDAA